MESFGIIIITNIEKYKMTKNKRELEIGDNIKEIKPRRGSKKRFGEILLILDDNPVIPR